MLRITQTVNDKVRNGPQRHSVSMNINEKTHTHTHRVKHKLNKNLGK